MFFTSPGRQYDRAGRLHRPAVQAQQCDIPSEVFRPVRCTVEVWDGQGLTLGAGPLRVGELPRIRFGMLLWMTSPDGLPGGGMLVCGCLLRTQQCVELVCSDWWCCASLMFCLDVSTAPSVVSRLVRASFCWRV